MRAVAHLLALACIALSACASASIREAEQGRDFQVVVDDNKEARRFDLRFVSLSSKPLCFQNQQWPRRGKVAWGSTYAFAEAEGVRYPISDFNDGYCIGECYTRVPPATELTGYLGYEEFPGLPEAGQHTLEFTLGVVFCRRGQGIVR